MKNTGNLFSKSPKEACLTYRRVRDAADERCESVRVQCENLWSEFAEHADANFLSEFAVNFHQRWFEMYLTVSFIRAGLTVRCLKPGPDVLVTVDGIRIWIEAVCATPGQDGNPDSVPASTLGKVQEIPIRQYVTRIRNSVEEKVKKFERYIDSGVVENGDFSVIAVNGGEIAGLAGYLDECMLRSLYGVGDIVVTIDRDSRRHTEADRMSVRTISKMSGAKIGVQPFVDGSMVNLSCVIASSVNAFNLPATRVGGYVLYPNLSCTTRWIENMLAVAEEWSFRETEEGWSGRRIDRE